MPVVHDITVHATSVASATATSAGFAVAATADRWAFIDFMSVDGGGAATHTSAVVEGDAGSRIGADLTGYFGVARKTAWTRLAPSAGAARTFTLTAADSEDIGIHGAISVYNGVDQTTPVANSGQSSGEGNPSTGATPAHTRVTVVGQVVRMGITVWLGGAGGDVTVSPTNGETTRIHQRDDNKTVIVLERTATGTSTDIGATLTWPSLSNAWGADSVAINEAASTGAPSLLGLVHPLGRSPEMTRMAFRAPLFAESAAGVTRTAVAADTNTPTDSALADTIKVAAAVDSANFTDSATSFTERVATASDTATFTDSAVAGASLPAVAADTISFTDSATATSSFAASASDTLSLSDSATAISTLTAAAADTIAFTDSAVAISTLVATATDTVSFTDSAVAIGPSSSASDTIVFSDSAVAVRVPGTPDTPVSLGWKRWLQFEGLERTVRVQALDGVAFTDSAEAAVETETFSFRAYLAAQTAIAVAQDSCAFEDAAVCIAKKRVRRMVKLDLVRTPLALARDPVDT